METKSKNNNEKKEKKVGVVPASELKGSDADKAYADEAPKTAEEGKQTEGSDADNDK